MGRYVCTSDEETKLPPIKDALMISDDRDVHQMNGHTQV